MYKSLQIRPPFFELGPKAYLYGDRALQLAKKADELCVRYDVRVIFTPQCVDIPLIARETKNILVFAQHMDSIKPGRGVGSVLPEAIKGAGAVGVLLNHVEKRITKSEIQSAIQRADEVGLASMVCADTAEDAIQIARMNPNIILAESPKLIGVGSRNSEDQVEISRINQLVWKINPEILVLHGAGITNGQDVYNIVKCGAQGSGSTSGVILAENPNLMLEEMIDSMRRAWDETYKN